MDTALLWLRQDLRLADNPALAAAARAERLAICFGLDETPERRAEGGAARWALHQALAALAADLAARGQRLILRRGRAADVLPALARETGATALFFNRRTDGPGRAIDATVEATLRGRGVAVHASAGTLLAEPETFRRDGHGPRVFTPFFRALSARPDRRKPVPAPARLPPPAAADSDRLESWGLLPQRPDWAAGLRARWRIGEAAAAEALHDFLDGAVARYAAERDVPAQDTSHLSPHLHWGTISSAQIWEAAQFAREAAPARAPGIDKFLSEIGWREFCQHLLADFPDLATRPLQARFARFPWREDAAGLHAWQRGETGYPLVDAGMRELWHSGFMHNRVRMVAASFLVKHLLIDWRAGEEWFWDTLVDADEASNPANWQWVAGCGADAAPYFRIFNPVLQSETFDPDGAYIRRWVPELARLDAADIHRPWEATPLALAAAGVRLRTTYPAPIVDHKAARARALAALDTIKNG